MFSGDKIRQLREKENLSLRDLEKITGLTFSFIANIERGIVKDPRISTIIKLANGFNVSVDELLNIDNL